MNARVDRLQLEQELPGWLLRGVLCAATSAGWACLMGFTTVAEIAGMIAGVVGWSAAFAVACATPSLPTLLRQPRLAAALKLAAWAKCGLSVLGAACFAAAGAIGSVMAEPLSALCLIDALPGMVSLWFVGRVMGLSGLEQVAAQDSFGWTALATMIDGAICAGMIVALAAVLLLWWRWRARKSFRSVFSLALPLA